MVFTGTCICINLLVIYILLHLKPAFTSLNSKLLICQNNEISKISS